MAAFNPAVWLGRRAGGVAGVSIRTNGHRTKQRWRHPDLHVDSSSPAQGVAVSPAADISDRNGGYTVLELIIALSLMSFLSLMLFGGLRFGTRAWETIDQSARSTDDVRLAQNWIYHEIAAAYPAYVRAPPPGHIEFSGTQDDIRFIAPVATALESAGYAHVQLRIVEGTHGFDLMADESPESPTASTATARYVIIGGLSSASFSYFGKTSANEASAWHDRWEARTELPRLVRITGAFPARDGRHWPDLFVSPRINADQSCIYDVLTRMCRGR